MNFWLTRHDERVDTLTSISAAVNRKHWFPNALGVTALHWAAVTSNVEAAELLLRNGARLDILDEYQMTPLHEAIDKEDPRKSPVAEFLVKSGAATEATDRSGHTALLLASSRANTSLVKLLLDHGANPHACSITNRAFLHLATSKEVFMIGIALGLDLHRKDAWGRSPVHYQLSRSDWASFLLNMDGDVDTSGAFVWTWTNHVSCAFLTDRFDMYLRKLGLERLRRLTNLEPTDSWSPLCGYASVENLLTLKNLVRLGAHLDFEGCPPGSALMAACTTGRLESVKFLVRHGASICYSGPKGPRSAVAAASRHDDIVKWLLVKRFTEQTKLTYQQAEGSMDDSVDDGTVATGRWSGPVQAELIISGGLERQIDESAQQYWFRLMAEKQKWRGRVVPSNSKATTWRSSRLIPQESVRICPGYYGTSTDMPPLA